MSGSNIFQSAIGGLGGDKSAVCEGSSTRRESSNHLDTMLDNDGYYKSRVVEMEL